MEASGTELIINVAESGSGKRAVMVSNDSGDQTWLHAVGVFEAKACFWAESLNSRWAGSRRLSKIDEEIGWPFVIEHV